MVAANLRPAVESAPDWVCSRHVSDAFMIHRNRKERRGLESGA